MNPSIFRMATVHRKLDEEIGRELKRRFPDRLRLQRLKKLRLALKDRLHRHANPGRKAPDVRTTGQARAVSNT